MDIVEKYLNRNRNKILDEFEFELKGKKYKIILEPCQDDLNRYYICFYKNIFTSGYYYQDLELINGLINAKKEFKRLKKKYGKSKKLTRFEQIKEFLWF